MFKRIFLVMVFAFGLAAHNLSAENLALQQPNAQQEQQPSKTQEYLTDAAIALIIIAASIAAYKSSGRPCACPEDMMRNGRRCGGNSAWARAGGAKPLCYVTDITGVMIKAYRATKAIPAMH